MILFRGLIPYLPSLIFDPIQVHRMPLFGIHLLISLLGLFLDEQREASWAPYTPLSFLFYNFLPKCCVHPLRTMPRSVSKASSSQDSVSMCYYLEDSLHQETPLSNLYPRDMDVHHVLADGRDVIQVHRDGTSYTVSSISISLKRTCFCIILEMLFAPPVVRPLLRSPPSALEAFPPWWARLLHQLKLLQGSPEVTTVAAISAEKRSCSGPRRRPPSTHASLQRRTASRQSRAASVSPRRSRFLVRFWTVQSRLRSW
jgi:hypothetical protein